MKLNTHLSSTEVKNNTCNFSVAPVFLHDMVLRHMNTLHLYIHQYHSPLLQDECNICMFIMCVPSRC